MHMITWGCYHWWNTGLLRLIPSYSQAHKGKESWMNYVSISPWVDNLPILTKARWGMGVLHYSGGGNTLSHLVMGPRFESRPVCLQLTLFTCRSQWTNPSECKLEARGHRRLPVPYSFLQNDEGCPSRGQIMLSWNCHFQSCEVIHHPMQNWPDTWTWLDLVYRP